jgi:glycine cleavage system H protein
MTSETLRFAKTHEWVAMDGDLATIGISNVAVELLTDIVFIDLPAVGRTVAAGETIGEIESVKAVSDMYAPVAGEIVAVNEDLPEDLSLLSDSPFEKGWICRIRVADGYTNSQLMTADDYHRHCESESH